MEYIEIAGLKINQFARKQLLETIEKRIERKQKTWATTLYSEFLYACLADGKLTTMLNQADLSLFDGIGLLWAHKFLNKSMEPGNYWLKISQAVWQAINSLVKLLFSQGRDKSILKERQPGSELVWELAELAEKKNFKIYLLGGFGDTPKKVARRLMVRYPKLKIVGYSNQNPDSKGLVEEISVLQPDILFVAFGPVKQERWIFENRNELAAILVMGVGGSFDYISGNRLPPPRILKSFGLEWMWRLFTQPFRVVRIYKATFGLVSRLILYKVQRLLPYRKNVAIVILNAKNEVFAGLRTPDKYPRNQNHWMVPQGGIEQGEDIVKAAIREIYEETHIKSVQHFKTSKQINTYEWPLGFSSKFRGQEQVVLYFRFKGDDSEINLSWHETKEFIDFKWVAIKDLMPILHEFRKPVGRIVLEDLKDLA